MDTLLEELKQENLCTHFILPLIKLNKFNFISSNFVNSYLTPSRMYIVVEVIDIGLLTLMKNCTEHPQYRGTSKGNDRHYLYFELPRKWGTDVKLFCEGKFSQLSDKAKEYIIDYSGLSYKQKFGKKTITDVRLLAFDRHDLLKEMWQNVFFGEHPGLKADPESAKMFDNMELLSIPGSESYFNSKEKGATQ